MTTKVSNRHAALATLLLLSAAVLAAAPFGPVLVMPVPFNFVVANQELPAGTYAVWRVTDYATGPLAVRNQNGDASVVVGSRPTTRNRAAGGAPILVFHRFGGHHFLTEIWPNQAAGYNLPPSQEELAYKNDGVEMTQVVVTARSDRQTE